MRPLKIISGGQTGVDRAALDVAIELGIPHGGWCPKGRKAEDGRIPERYQLRESQSDRYPPRTRLNVAWSGATLLLAGRLSSPGSQLTVSTCQQQGKPVRNFDPRDLSESNVQACRAWLEEVASDDTLNVAGPRESSSPGIHAAAKAFLLEVLR